MPFPLPSRAAARLLLRAISLSVRTFREAIRLRGGGGVEARTGSLGAGARHLSAALTAKKTAPSGPAAVGVFVKVGSSNSYLRLICDGSDAMAMDAAALLEALAGSKLYRLKLKGVDISGCSVAVLKGAPPSGGTDADAAEATEMCVALEGAMTLSDASTKGACAGKPLYIRVRLPSEPAASLVAFRSLGSGVVAAHAAMHPLWQGIASRLSSKRAALASTAMLCRSAVDVTVSEAPSMGLTVLHQDAATSVVRLGVFQMPPISEDIAAGPKGLPLDEPQPWFHLEQRAVICREFLAAMQAPVGASRRFGVLLSGPNGTGKSAIGVEAMMSSFARNLVTVYISASSEWVRAAEEGRGDAFLLQRLLRQNADLIAAQPILRQALEPALVKDPAAVGRMGEAGEIMDALRSVLTETPFISVGIIVDEVQAISFAIRDGKSDKALATERAAAMYFKHWHNWDNVNRVFVRLDIASSHGVRELKLPAGENHRLRIIKPWTADVVTALTKAEASPCAFPAAHERARQRIVYTAGGIPRSLFEGRKLLNDALAAGVALPQATALAEDELRLAMKDNCLRWFDALGSSERQIAVAREMLRLVRGEVEWDIVKGLFDDGIVARCNDVSSRVTPVSPAAASVIIAQLAPYYRKYAVRPLLGIKPGAQRGYELEMQVVACLVDAGVLYLPAKVLQGNEAATDVPACTDERISFENTADIVAHETLARLYLPTSTEFACDAITVPPTSAEPTEPIVVWETSVTPPRNSKRVAKVRKWFRPVGYTTPKTGLPGPAGIITQLRAAHPLRPIICALCWPDNLLDAGKETAHADLSKDAAACSAQGPEVQVVVVDVAGLQALGVLV